MNNPHNPLYYGEIFEAFEKLGWNIDPKELQIYSTIAGHQIRGVSIEVEMFLFPNESIIQNYFLFESEEHKNRHTRSFLKSLQKAITLRGAGFEQATPTNYQMRWDLSEVGLFEDCSQKEIIQKMLEQYRKGCLFACSYAHAIHECAMNSKNNRKKQDHSALVDFCLLGFMGLGPQNHA